jgi:hypothetical protein
MFHMKKSEAGVFALSFFVLFMTMPLRLQASGNWKEVASTKQKDIWYVEQIIGFSSKGTVMAARARLKFVPGKESAVGQNVKKGLLRDGVNADKLHYFVESVEVDCKKKLFTISNIDFFDAEDAKIFGQTFAEPKSYPSTPGSAFEIISWDLCQNKPGVIDILKDTLKNKKPFLYLFSRDETAK